MNRRLLITDLDHTLLDDQSEISPENLSAIRRHVEGGGLFTVATGRPPVAARMFTQLLPYLNIPSITGNGGQICDLSTGECFYRRTLPEGMEFVLANIMERFSALGAVSYCDDGGFYCFRTNIHVDNLMITERRPAAHIAVEASPKPWGKVLMAQDHAYLEEVRDYAAPLISGLARTVFSEPNFLEMLPLGVSKGEALRFLMDREGLVPEQVVAMGDALNDLEMLQVAGVGVAVANAVPELIAAADAVVCGNNEHAVRACVERFLT